MDLLDERMAQYSVFSVTMSVDKQIIISGIVCTVLPAKSDSDAVFCLQLLSKTLTCTLNLS